MNRRGFFGAVLGGFAAAVGLRSRVVDPVRVVGTGVWVVDPYCATNRIYFLNPNTLYFKHVGYFGADKS